jgi:hypothetical protein
MLIAGVVLVAMLLPVLNRRHRATDGTSLAALIMLIFVAVFGGAAVGVLVFTVLR